MEKLKKIEKIIKIFLIVGSLFLFGWLVGKNFVFFGTMTTTYDFKNNNAFISVLKPVGRTLAIKRNRVGDYTQKIIVDPVYFNLYLPTKFQRANFVFVFRAPTAREIKVGPQIKGVDWTYNLKKISCDKKIKSWCFGEVDFNLANANIKNKKIKFMISSPKLDVSGEQIELNKIKVTLFK